MDRVVKSSLRLRLHTLTGIRLMMYGPRAQCTPHTPIHTRQHSLIRASYKQTPEHGTHSPPPHTTHTLIHTPATHTCMRAGDCEHGLGVEGVMGVVREGWWGVGVGGLAAPMRSLGWRVRQPSFKRSRLQAPYSKFYSVFHYSK